MRIDVDLSVRMHDALLARPTFVQNAFDGMYDAGLMLAVDARRDLDIWQAVRVV